MINNKTTAKVKSETISSKKPLAKQKLKINITTDCSNRIVNNVISTLKECYQTDNLDHLYIKIVLIHTLENI